MRVTAEEIIEYLESRQRLLVEERDRIEDRLKDASPSGDMASLLRTFNRWDAKVGEIGNAISEIHRLEWVKERRA